MKLFLKLIGPILCFTFTVVINTMIGLELIDYPAIVIILMAFTSACMGVLTGIYVIIVLREYYAEQALKELKEEKDEGCKTNYSDR